MLKTIFAIASVVTLLTPAISIPNSRPLGIVEGVTNCGGFGILGTVSVSDCTVLPCHFIPNNIYDVAIRFTASISSENLKLFVYRVGMPGNLFNVPINGHIEAEIEYELTFQLPISYDFAGHSFEIRFFILDEVNLRSEVCAQAPVTVGNE